MEQLPGSGSGPFTTKGEQAMPATREVLSRPERLSDRQDSAAGRQHDYATRGEAEVMPARAEPRSWSAQEKPRPGQWAVRAVIKAGLLEQRLQIARLSCEDASCEATAGAVASL